MFQQFHDAGYKVFGINAFDANGVCQCGSKHCYAAGKHPIAKNWQYTPIWSDEQFDTAIESGQFESGYGVLCDSLLVIDVDARNGGVESFARLLQSIPEIQGAGLIVETGSGGGSKHYYFKLPQADSTALVQHLNEYSGIDFKSSGFVVGPGSRHVSGNNYTAVIGDPFDISVAPDALLELLIKKESRRVEYNGASIDINENEIRNALTYIKNDLHYDDYIRIGMAIHHVTGGCGFELWDEWARQSDKYTGKTIQQRWHSFGKSNTPVTVGTLLYFAEQNGWTPPVTFTPTVEFEYIENNNGLPFNVSGIDLKRPPGFVGEVAAWINSQCRYPMESAATLAALVSVGSISGLRYTDDLDGVTTNLLGFCVAGSATGKDSIFKAVNAVYKAAGIIKTVHGSIKSEQEIIRNLVDQQAANYLIDEIGIFLQKIVNAQKRGGAPYLDGVIGSIMSVYTKADDFLPVTGDVRREVKRLLQNEISSINKNIENGYETTRDIKRLETLNRAVESIDSGIERPFLSLLGFTTPVTFESLVTKEQATNGFIGRAVIVSEKNTNPRPVIGFKKSAMPDNLALKLAALYNCGEFDSFSDGDRVEFYGNKVKIPTTNAAKKMLGDALEWILNHADEHVNKTGLESVVRRGYEMISKISLILGIHGGLRDEQCVRWAFEFVRRDIEEKTRLAYANDNIESNPSNALEAKILNMIDADNGGTISFFANRLRKSKNEIETALNELIKRGLVVENEALAANGKMVVKYFAIDA